MKLIGLVAAALMIPAIGRAQNCLGLPTFASPFRLTGSAQFGDGYSFYGAGIGAGKQNGLFGSIGGGTVKYENPDGSSGIFFLEGGFELKSSSKLRACPVAGVSYEKLPDEDDISASVRSGTVGLALGVPVSAGQGLDVVPNGSVRFLYSSLKVDDARVGSATDNQSSGLVDLGLALVLNDWFSIQPTVQIPFGVEGAETTWGIFAAFSFGRRK
jgi:hypothetical protein